MEKLTRRKFLGLSALGAAAVVTGLEVAAAEQTGAPAVVSKSVNVWDLTSDELIGRAVAGEQFDIPFDKRMKDELLAAQIFDDNVTLFLEACRRTPNLRMLAWLLERKQAIESGCYATLEMANDRALQALGTDPLAQALFNEHRVEAHEAEEARTGKPSTYRRVLAASIHSNSSQKPLTPQEARARTLQAIRNLENLEQAGKVPVRQRSFDFEAFDTQRVL